MASPSQRLEAILAAPTCTADAWRLDYFAGAPGADSVCILLDDGGDVDGSDGVGAGVGGTPTLGLDWKVLPAIHAATLPMVLTASPPGDNNEAARFSAASALLCATPFNATAWNVRKRRLTTSDVVDLLPALAAELRFCSAVQCVHAKCAEAWAHRWWAVRHVAAYLDSDNAAAAAAAAGLLAAELRVAAARGAKLRPRNYAAWTHRLCVFRTLTQRCRCGDGNNASEVECGSVAAILHAFPQAPVSVSTVEAVDAAGTGRSSSVAAGGYGGDPGSSSSRLGDPQADHYADHYGIGWGRAALAIASSELAATRLHAAIVPSDYSCWNYRLQVIAGGGGVDEEAVSPRRIAWALSRVEEELALVRSLRPLISMERDAGGSEDTRSRPSTRPKQRHALAVHEASLVTLLVRLTASS